MHKKFFHFTGTNVYKNSIFLFCFFIIWLSVKYKDFLINSNLSQNVHVVFCSIKTNYKYSKKVQHVSCAQTCCTFSGKVKVPFRVFDKLKNEIQKFMIRFCFYFNMRNESQITDMYCYVKIDFYFEFSKLFFVFHFHKRWKTKYRKRKRNFFHF